MNIVSAKHDLLENFKESKEYRESFTEENVYALLCAQMRVLREERGWSQKQLGRNTGMAQERISILEDPNAATKPTLNTLLRMANGYDIGLEVRFVPFSRVLNSSFNNDPGSLGVKSFRAELEEAETQAQRLSTTPLSDAVEFARDGSVVVAQNPFSVGQLMLGISTNSVRSAQEQASVQGKTSTGLTEQGLGLAETEAGPSPKEFSQGKSSNNQTPHSSGETTPPLYIRPVISHRRTDSDRVKFSRGQMERLAGRRKRHA